MSKSHMIYENDSISLIEDLITNLNKGYNFASNEVASLKKAHLEQSKALDPGDSDMIAQLKRCNRAIRRYETIQRINLALLKNAKSSLDEFREM